jgi:hypothetical protein
MTYRYLWELRTKDSPYTGTEGAVTIALHGSNGVTEPLPLATQQFGVGQLANGIIEADEDLGNIVSATVQAQLAPGRPWDIDFVRVTRLRDGFAWIALEVGTCTEEGCPLVRFLPLSIYPTVPAEPNQGERPTGQDEPQNTNGRGPADFSGLVRNLKAGIEDIQRLGSPRQVRIAQRIGKALMPLVRELLGETTRPLIAAEPQSDFRQSEPSPSPGVPFLVELFGQHGAKKVQLRTVANFADGQLGVNLGARLTLTRQRSEGFGLALSGEGARSFGELRFSYDESDFDVVALDGFTVRRVPVEVLVGLFGVDWPKVVLGNSVESGA